MSLDRLTADDSDMAHLVLPTETHSLPLPERLGDFCLTPAESTSLPAPVAVPADPDLVRAQREVSEDFLRMLERELNLPRG